MTQVDELLAFLGEAITPFHAVSAMAGRLLAAGFSEVERFDTRRDEARFWLFYDAARELFDCGAGGAVAGRSWPAFGRRAHRQSQPLCEA